MLTTMLSPAGPETVMPGRGLPRASTSSVNREFLSTLIGVSGSVTNSGFLPTGDDSLILIVFKEIGRTVVISVPLCKLK